MDFGPNMSLLEHLYELRKRLVWGSSGRWPFLLFLAFFSPKVSSIICLAPIQQATGALDGATLADAASDRGVGNVL